MPKLQEIFLNFVLCFNSSDLWNQWNGCITFTTGGGWGKKRSNSKGIAILHDLIINASKLPLRRNPLEVWMEIGTGMGYHGNLE